MTAKSTKYYLMSNKIPLSRYDGTEPPGIYQRSHDMLMTKTGDILIDYSNDDENGEPFIGSLICDLDDEYQTGKLPTFFTSPGLIATKEFYNDLVEMGIENIEVHPTIIRDLENEITIENYLFLNILGQFLCTKTIDYDEIGIYPDKVPEHLNMFLVDEPNNIIVTERVYLHLKKKYEDIFFEEIPQLKED